MTLNQEQVQSIKEQLIGQVNSTFPEDKKQEAIEKIESMNGEQLEQFLIQNNLIKSEDSQAEGKCIFCSIIFEEIPSYKIAENEKTVAVLEINPLSKGHTLILPKEHLNEFPKQAEDFAEEIKEKLKSVLSPKDILKEHSEMFGHAVLNLIPVYDDEELKQRKSADKKELEELQKQLTSEAKEEIEKKEAEEKPAEEINEKNAWLPVRIP